MHRQRLSTVRGFEVPSRCKLRKRLRPVPGTLARDAAWEGISRHFFRVWNPIETSYIKDEDVSNFRFQASEWMRHWIGMAQTGNRPLRHMKFETSEMSWNCLRASVLVWHMLTWQLGRHPSDPSAFEVSKISTSLLLIRDVASKKNPRTSSPTWPSKIFQEIQRYRPKAWSWSQKLRVVCFPSIPVQFRTHEGNHGSFVFGWGWWQKATSDKRE